MVKSTWFGVLVLIGGAFAVVEFWVVGDEPTAPPRHTPSTATVAALTADVAAALEITPILEGTEIVLPSPTSRAQPTEAAQASEPTAMTVDAPTPSGTPDPSNTPRPTVSPVPSQTNTPESTESDTPEPTETPVPKPTDTPEPEEFKLYYKSMPDRSKQVYHLSGDTKEMVAIFDPGSGRRDVHSAAWSPGGEHVLTAAEWKTSDIEFGDRLRLDNRDGSGGYDIIFMNAYGVGGAVRARGMGSAIWSPDGQSIAMWHFEGANDGVYILNPDGSGLRRMANSQPGDWPRWWSVDGEWIVVVNDDGNFWGLDVAETSRVPWASLEGMHLYDQRSYPWRVTDKPKCNNDQITTKNCWWSCK